jgi:hypothetical protein
MPTMTAMTTFSGYSWNLGVTAVPPLSLRSILSQEQGGELLPQRRIEGPRYQSDHERLRDSIGDFDLTAFRGHSYFSDTISHKLLDLPHFPLRENLFQIKHVALLGRQVDQVIKGVAEGAWTGSRVSRRAFRSSSLKRNVNVTFEAYSLPALTTSPQT